MSTTNQNSLKSKQVNRRNESKKKCEGNLCELSSHEIRGYSNLFENIFDNLSHVATIGGTFSLNSRIGLRTLFSMLIHEIPHEMTDFRILLHSGFNRSEAIFTQLYTGSSAIISSLVTQMFQ